jgi:hypothetical protein
MRSDAISKTRNFREASAPRSSTGSSFRRISLIVFVAVTLARAALAPPRLARGERTVVLAAAGSSRRSGVSGVEGLAALGVCVVLRCLATVEFPVVAYDPCSSDPCLVIRCGSVLVRLRCSCVLPRYEQNQVAGR